MTRKIILASASPRRKELLEALGYEFEIYKPDIDESFFDSQSIEENLLRIALEKAKFVLQKTTNKDAIIIAADTVVILNNEILGKPKDTMEAKEMLLKLSGKTHKVATAYTIYSSSKMVNAIEYTNVCFNELSEAQIEFYCQNYNPLDKAGAYAIQEWIGMIGINKIDGCYYNVMGLPTYKIYLELERF